MRAASLPTLPTHCRSLACYVYTGLVEHITQHSVRGLHRPNLFPCRLVYSASLRRQASSGSEHQEMQTGSRQGSCMQHRSRNDRDGGKTCQKSSVLIPETQACIDFFSSAQYITTCFRLPGSDHNDCIIFTLDTYFAIFRPSKLQHTSHKVQSRRRHLRALLVRPRGWHPEDHRLHQRSW
jgi:hypothetical protein